MIHLTDAWVLASTKLRTRKTRTIVTAVLASLLFAGLVGAFSLVKGGVDSYARFSKNGLSQRYIANTFFYSYGSQTDWNSPALIAKAKERNKQVIVDKKADAKRLGIEYDANSEPPVSMTDGGSGEYVNVQNFAVQQVLKEAQASDKTPLDLAKEVAKNYRPKQFYEAKSLGDTNNLTIMKAGKESFELNTKPAQMYGPDPLTTLAYVSRDISDSFLLDGADLTVAKSSTDPIPVIVTFSDAEKALNLTPLPKTAKNKDRLQRIEDVKKSAVNVQLSICYRNDASKQFIEQAKQQIAEIEAHKSDPTYQKPSQIYALPDVSSCGPVVVVKDTRSYDEKQYAGKLKEFNLKYNIEVEPVQKKLTFRIVGLSADLPDYGNMGTFDNLVAMIGGTSLMGQWVVPTELVDSSIQGNIIPAVNSSTGTVWNMGGSLGTLIEFSSAADAKRFLTEKNCNTTDCSTKPVITYFGSNSVLIEDIMRNASGVLQIAGIILSSIAAVLMMGMVGRVITDSRRETAVFRAIGAKRNDIRLIYALYVTAFSLIIAVSALVIGLGLAQLYSSSVADSLTVSARLMFLESHETAPFQLVGLWPQAIALTVGVIVLAGLVSMLLPLGRNLARSPLKDMRDE